MSYAITFDELHSPCKYISGNYYGGACRCM